MLHTCFLEEAEVYGDFLNYTYSHYEIWEKHYREKYQVDFDFYPRGRIVYNKKNNQYILYYDKCIENEAKEMQGYFPKKNCKIARDEHYQCHQCNSEYVV